MYKLIEVQHIEFNILNFIVSQINESIVFGCMIYIYNCFACSRYMIPEYAYKDFLSDKLDVYSSV